MNKIEAAKKPAIVKLWLIKSVRVYIFIIVSFIGIKYGLTFYFKHKYPPETKKSFFGIFSENSHSDKWLTLYDKWSTYFYLAAISAAGLWMIILIKPTLEEADYLLINALKKADDAEAGNDLSLAFYNLKIASSLSINRETLKRINERIEKIRSSLSSSISISKAKPDRRIKTVDIDNTVVKKTINNKEYIANRYKKIRKLGQGGMGVVWLSEDITLERQIAIKELPVRFADDKELKERFFREAKLLAKLTHPNIIQLYDIIDDEDTLYYTMEFVDGVSLDKLLRSSRPPINTTLDYALQILKGIEYAHSMKIIHRDLKPMNIMVRKDDIIKVADFGLAKLVGNSSLTIAGTVMGSPMYMSPEQASGEDTDERSDIYSFSMVLYELVTGVTAFAGPTADILAKQIRTMPPHPSSLVTIPAWLDEAIMKGLAKDRKQRYQDASEMIEHIKKHRSEI